MNEGVSTLVMRYSIDSLEEKLGKTTRKALKDIPMPINTTKDKEPNARMMSVESIFAKVAAGNLANTAD